MYKSSSLPIRWLPKLQLSAQPNDFLNVGSNHELATAYVKATDGATGIEGNMQYTSQFQLYYAVYLLAFLFINITSIRKANIYGVYRELPFL